MDQKPFECPSIYIPRIFKNVGQRKIHAVFAALNLGEIDTIDLRLGRDFQNAIIYFKCWYTTEDAVAIKGRFLEGEEIKIIYDEPWFWKCRLNIKKNIATKESYHHRYNSSNQILALKRKMSEERKVFKQLLAEKDMELDTLRDIILCYKEAGAGDDALIWRKKIQQQKAKQLNKEKNIVNKLNNNV